MRLPISLLLASLAGLAIVAPAAAQEAAPTPAEECSIQVDFSEDARAIVESRTFSFSGFATLCQQLQDAGFGVRSGDFRGMIEGRAFGITALSLFDLATGIGGHSVLTSTGLQEASAEDVSMDALYDAINDGMQTMSERPDEFIRPLQEDLARLPGVLATSPAPRAASEGCSFDFVAPQELIDHIDGWPDFSFGDEAMCQRLAEQGALLELRGAAGELSGKTYAWLMVALQDRHSGITGRDVAVNFTLFDTAEDNALDRALRQAAGGALAQLAEEPDIYFYGLVAETTRTREALGVSAAQ